MKDVMLDLETFGTAPGCVVRSIGAVFFDLEGNIGKEFYSNIDTADSQSHGLTIDPKTAEWWAKQSDAAQAALLDNPRDLAGAVELFKYWFTQHGGERVWCQGANFDAPVWEAAVKAVGHAVPWKFWDIRDTRTVYQVFKFNPKTLPRTGTYHNALDDAKYQVACIHAAMGKTIVKSQSVFE